MKSPVFRSAQARSRLHAWYGKFLKRIPGEVEHREVMTAHGASHVLVAGDSEKPPLVCLHGALASSAHAVSELRPLLDRYRVFAPDLPGQSVRGPELRLPFDGKAHSRWLIEVLDGLGLGSVNLLGVSWGGFVALETAARSPQRIGKLALLVPAGVVTGSAWAGILRSAVPLTIYRVSPSDRNLRRFLDGLLTTWDDDWANYLGDAMRDFTLDFRPPPLATMMAFSGFEAPALVIAAEDDLSFPGEKMITRIREILPLAETELIEGSRHCPPMTDEFRHWLGDRLAAFFAGEIPCFAQAGLPGRAAGC